MNMSSNTFLWMVSYLFTSYLLSPIMICLWGIWLILLLKKNHALKNCMPWKMLIKLHLQNLLLKIKLRLKQTMLHVRNEVILYLNTLINILLWLILLIIFWMYCWMHIWLTCLLLLNLNLLMECLRIFTMRNFVIITGYPII